MAHIPVLNVDPNHAGLAHDTAGDVPKTSTLKKLVGAGITGNRALKTAYDAAQHSEWVVAE